MNNKGFTLIEALLSITILVIIAGLSIPVAQRFYTRNNLDVATHSLVQTIRKTQSFAMGSNGDSKWGIRFSNPTITVFKGENFAGREQEFDENYDMPNTVRVSGIEELVFDKMSGLPNTTQDIILTNSDGETKTISTNSKGFISY